MQLNQIDVDHAVDTNVALQKYTVWPHPFQDAQIYINPEVIRKLSSESLRCLKAKPPSEVGGVLWGKLPTAPHHLIVIQDAEFISSEGPLYNVNSSDARAIARAVKTRERETNVVLVGYFRSYIRDGLCLTAEDQKLIENEFRHPNTVFLVIKPFEIGISMAGFFFWQNGRLQTDVSDLEVPFIAAERSKYDNIDVNDAVPELNALNRSMPSRPESEGLRIHGLREGSVAKHHGDPEASYRLSNTTPNRSTFVRSEKFFARGLLISIGTSILTILLSVIGGAVLYVAWSALHVRLESMGGQASKTEIGLQVNPAPDGHLEIDWNGNEPRFANAESATLSILDGLRLREINLNSSQFRLGRISYFPDGSEVQFRLEIYLNDTYKRSVSESVRVEPVVIVPDAGRRLALPDAAVGNRPGAGPPANHRNPMLYSAK